MQIEAKELRVGNTIKRISNGNYCTVNWGIIKEFELYETEATKDYERVLLTEDIITEKIGLINNGFGGYEIKVMPWWNSNIPIRIFRIGMGGGDSGFIIWDDNLFLAAVHYLDELENIYYDLTKKTLELK